jgi:uncharacterized membrane-anchored protein
MRRRVFVALVLLQGVVLAAWATSLERQIAGAEHGRLAVAQRDPRDFLRGDYVWLNYEIDEVFASALEPGQSPPRPGDPVWVALAAKDGVWRMARASLVERPREGPFIVGRVEYLIPARGASEPARVRVDYGIGRYYVPEGKGTLPRGNTEAEVALTRDGRAFLIRLFVDGRSYP